MEERRNAIAEIDQPLPLPRLRTGPVDFKDLHARGQFGPALHESVEAGTEDHVLIYAAGG